MKIAKIRRYFFHAFYHFRHRMVLRNDSANTIHRGLFMCNTCGGCNQCNQTRNNNCGCVNLLSEVADAINNFFTNPCGCGCGCNNQWQRGFESGYSARGNSRTWRNGFERGWAARANNGCGCYGYNEKNGYDAYYARQYGLNGNRNCCSL